MLNKKDMFNIFLELNNECDISLYNSGILTYGLTLEKYNIRLNLLYERFYKNSEKTKMRDCRGLSYEELYLMCNTCLMWASKITERYRLKKQLKILEQISSLVNYCNKNKVAKAVPMIKHDLKDWKEYDLIVIKYYTFKRRQYWQAQVCSRFIKTIADQPLLAALQQRHDKQMKKLLVEQEKFTQKFGELIANDKIEYQKKRMKEFLRAQKKAIEQLLDTQDREIRRAVLRD